MSTLKWLMPTGWVRTLREAMKGATLFVELNDGSCLASIQVVCGSDSTAGFADAKACGGAGASLRVEGAVVESPGKGQAIDNILICLAADGHVLIEDLPGVGKTTLAYCLAKSMHSDFKRVQFTSDLLPTDVTGVSIYDEREKHFIFKKGPIFESKTHF